MAAAPPSWQVARRGTVAQVAWVRGAQPAPSLITSGDTQPASEQAALASCWGGGEVLVPPPRRATGHNPEIFVRCVTG